MMKIFADFDFFAQISSLNQYKSGQKKWYPFQDPSFDRLYTRYYKLTHYPYGFESQRDHRGKANRKIGFSCLNGLKSTK